MKRRILSVGAVVALVAAGVTLVRRLARGDAAVRRFGSRHRTEALLTEPARTKLLRLPTPPPKPTRAFVVLTVLIPRLWDRTTPEAASRRQGQADRVTSSENGDSLWVVA